MFQRWSRRTTWTSGSKLLGSRWRPICGAMPRTFHSTVKARHTAQATAASGCSDAAERTDGDCARSAATAAGVGRCAPTAASAPAARRFSPWGS